MAQTALEKRLHRLEGQLTKLRERITAEADCSDIIPQFLAVRGALNAAFELYMKESLADCPLDDEVKRDKLIQMLIKK